MKRTLLILSLLPACEPEKGLDWCIERQDEEAIHASGTLRIDYQGRFAQGPVSIDPYVKLPAGLSGLITKGCATDRQGTLWAFHGGWLIPEGSTFPLQLQREQDNAESFSGRLFVCPHEDCGGEHEQEVVGNFFGPNGIGEVLAFDPAAGSFSGKVRVINALNETIDVDANLSWVPLAP